MAGATVATRLGENGHDVVGKADRFGGLARGQRMDPERNQSAHGQQTERSHHLEIPPTKDFGGKTGRLAGHSGRPGSGWVLSKNDYKTRSLSKASQKRNFLGLVGFLNKSLRNWYHNRGRSPPAFQGGHNRVGYAKRV